MPDADGGHNFSRFRFKHAARGIDRVGSHVEDRAGLVSIAGAMILGVHFLDKGRGEQNYLAKLP